MGGWEGSDEGKLGQYTATQLTGREKAGSQHHPPVRESKTAHA